MSAPSNIQVNGPALLLGGLTNKSSFSSVSLETFGFLWQFQIWDPWIPSNVEKSVTLTTWTPSLPEGVTVTNWTVIS